MKNIISISNDKTKVESTVLLLGIAFIIVGVSLFLIGGILPMFVASLLFVWGIQFSFNVIGIKSELLGNDLDISDINIGSDLDDKLGSKIKHEINDSFTIISFDIRDYKDKTEFENFASTYFSELEAVVNEANNQIYVLDYMAHHKPLKVHVDGHGKKDEVDLAEFYQKYFQTIENAVKSKNLRYIRILQLPFDINRHKDIDKTEAALDLIFPQTYQHICNFKGYGKFSLYILDKPVRPYSMALIDSECLICEYDRYDKEGKSFPDILFIDKVVKENNSSKLKEFIVKQRNLVERTLDINPEAATAPIQNRMLPTTIEELKIRQSKLLNQSREWLKEVDDSFTKFKKSTPKGAKEALDILMNRLENKHNTEHSLLVLIKDFYESKQAELNNEQIISVGSYLEKERKYAERISKHYESMHV